MSLKLAVGGKGGVGKTTVSGLLSRLLAEKGKRVIAIDADPVTNLAAALGISEEEPITPIAELSDLIEERTGSKPGTMGGFFTMNPKVDDIPERFSRERDGVKLLVMGTVQSGGSGCICPESTMLKALMMHLVLYRDEVILMDMEAGVEHLGRATTKNVDALLVVVNPGARSMNAVKRIRKLAGDLGITRILALGNRVRNDKDRELIRQGLEGSGIEILGFLPETDEIAEADRNGVRPYEDLSALPDEFKELADKLLSLAD